MNESYLQRQTTADGVDTFYSVQYQQTFHSKYGALLEAEHVFLKGTGVRQRLLEGRPTCILEVGFGVGLNFWMTIRDHLKGKAALHYVALEQNLLTAELLAQLNHSQVLEAAGGIRQAFLDWRKALPDPLPAAPLRWESGDSLKFELILGDATGAPIPSLNYHAIYHDPFSPEANPELWTPAFFARLYQVLAPGGKLATYSAKGSVRRNLQSVGFQVQKMAGPPGKREMLVATK